VPEKFLLPTNALLSVANSLFHLTLCLPYDNRYHPEKQPARHSDIYIIQKSVGCLIEKRRGHNFERHLLFMNYEKAFDTIVRAACGETEISQINYCEQ
jgi:hypothetical protein